MNQWWYSHVVERGSKTVELSYTWRGGVQIYIGEYCLSFQLTKGGKCQWNWEVVVILKVSKTSVKQPVGIFIIQWAFSSPVSINKFASEWSKTKAIVSPPRHKVHSKHGRKNNTFDRPLRRDLSQIGYWYLSMLGVFRSYAASGPLCFLGVLQCQ